MLIAVFGFVIWLVTIFQTFVGMRWIKLGKRHRVVHKWVGFAIVGLAPIHGLLATMFFLGWPIPLR